ncbi:MAG: SusC/RagA family TonB-linked outer membrane protein [Bacteroidetes bacterium]|nr:SusC/RagA family TonB-linked outer membrane protein [Bacteroidota bacterium]
MKLTILLTLLLSVNVSASVYSQTSKLDLNINNLAVRDVLKIVESKTSYRFFYSDDFNALDKTVSCDLHQASLETILQNVLHNTQATYTKLENNVIVISPFSAQQQNKLTGTVTDASTNEPIVGAIVSVEGTTIGVQTDVNGHFSLNLPKSNAVIKVAFMGYLSEKITLKGQTKIDIKLTSDVKRLDEVVVVGYGTVRKRDLTGTVSSMKTEELVKSPAGNVMEAVQGKISGVDIIRSSGAAGAGISITVRGNRSINAGNDPLYIVDGIQYSNIQDVNPNDILSMDILKDASTTAIYGSRGANGVIIITTKRGSEGKVKVTAGTYYGISDIAGYPKPMNGTQFANLKRQAYKTNGIWNSTADDSKVFTSASEIAAINANTSTYWPGLILNQGSQQDYVVGVSGGTDKTKVYFSFDYFKEKGLLNNDFSNRYTLRLNIDQTIFNNFKVGLESQLAYYDQNLRNDNILTVANKVLPYFAPYNADGSLPKYPGNGNQVNPLMEEISGSYINQNNITRILSTAYAEWKPVKGLTIRSNLGVVNASTRNGHFEDANTISRALSTGSLSSVTNTTQTDLTWENIITYQKKFGDHSLNLMAVTSYLSNRSDNSSASGTGQLLANQSFYALQNNPSNLAISSNYVGSNMESGAFRFNYSFKEKYLLTFTGREDGASVLAPKNRWAFFPSAAAAWRVIDEKFMKGIPVISDLKLRGSYGVAGNSAVKPYQTQSGVMLIPFAWNDVAALAYGLQPQIGNENLKWELTTTQNFGIDFGILKNRISGSVDIYDSKTKDLLYLQQLPTTSGGQSMLNNVGKTRNSGIEVSLKTINIEGKDFSWSSNITYTRNKERIVYLPNGSDIANSLIIGSPVNSFYDYQKIGIWQTVDATTATSYGYKPGDIRVLDVNGDGKITAVNDRMVVGSAVPLYSIGFNNDFKYKSFDLNVFVFARIGQTFVSSYALKYEPNGIENGAVVDYWTPDNPTNAYPQPDSKISRAALPFATTLGYKDGSFVKIRNITLGYTLPSTLAKKLHVTSIRWYASAKNYFTFSKVKDYDPEGGGSFEHPLTKLIVTGLNIEF